MDNTKFKEQYNLLNKAQKEAVEAIEGPVMVVAGPGTGKTQVLALRIANILTKTDTKADGILCLTFTNSGGRARRPRLEDYIGKEGANVHISTFHSFAIELVEKHYELLDFPKVPELLTDEQAVFLVDEILHDYEWEYIRPRTNPTMYFSELKQLISILKRERLSPEEFLKEVESDIKSLENDPESISTRGDSKGKMKKEVEKKIESLLRTKEVVEFYRIYEEKKKEQSFMDYDDVLEYAVKLVENFPDVASDIKENFLYVLVDEHQDSSGVQNSFLKAVWKGEDTPNIFVVGDDRQLIYGFSGANIDYFTDFKTCFGKAKQIILTENYRSTAPILALADELLQSSITKEVLNSNKNGDEKVILSEYSYPRDEILGAGIYFKEKIKDGIKPEECAILVPKNYQVREAMQILKDMGIPVSSGKSMSLWSAPQAESFYRVLNIISDPYNSILLAESILDDSSKITGLTAHKFLKSLKAEALTIDDIIKEGNGEGLFAGENPISKWGQILKGWVDNLINEKLSQIIAIVGNELLIDQSKDHDALLRNVEVVRSFIHLSMEFEAKNENAKLKDFLEYITRLQSYGNHIELATFGGAKGVQVMTLHKSKGLQYKCVWIAHMNEEVLMSEKRNGFTLPEKVKIHIHERDVASAKRELYVALTRAEEFCTISYASESLNGAELELAEIIKELSESHFVKKTKEETESELLTYGPKVYTEIVKEEEGDSLDKLTEFVKEHFTETKVSVTMLNNFFECSWKWYFRSFLKLPEIKGVPAILGTAVHNTIEFILKEKTLPKDVDIKSRIKYELQKEGVQDEKELKRLFKDAESAVSGWIENYYKNLAKDYTSERPVQFRDTEFGDLLMYGKLDLTERFPDGSITVTDFKTGKSKTKNEIEKMDEEGRLSSYMRQLAMYSYLVAGAEKGKEVTTSRLLFLEAQDGDKNALYSAHINEEQIDLLKKDIREYHDALVNGTWVNNTCHYKPWGSGSDECPYCKLSKRIFDI
jgi:DNA helicase-2/ATP-dependent DNA helicase PcrA